MLSCSVVSDSLWPPWTVACQTLLSMGFSRQEYWSGLPCPPPGELPNPGTEPRSPTLQADSLLSEPPGHYHITGNIMSTSMLLPTFSFLYCFWGSQPHSGLCMSSSPRRFPSLSISRDSSELHIHCLLDISSFTPQTFKFNIFITVPQILFFHRLILVKITTGYPNQKPRNDAWL